MSSRGARMRASYDQLAERFAAEHGTMAPEVEPWAEQLLRGLPQSPLLADVGCGPGGHSRWFDERGARVVAVDLSAEMLRVVRRDAVERVVQADMTQLPLKPASLDAVWCSASLLHVEPELAPGVLAAFLAVLRPGGGLFLGMQQGEGAGWSSHRVGVERFFARYSLGELCELVRAAGFTIEDAQRDGPPSPWMQVLATAAHPAAAASVPP